MSDKNGTSLMNNFANPKAKALFEKYKMSFPLDKNKTDYYIKMIDSGSKSKTNVSVYYRISNFPNLHSWDNRNNARRRLRHNLEKHPIHLSLLGDGGVIESTFIVDKNILEPPVRVNYSFDNNNSC